MTKFNIGDTVYRAQAGQETVWITCPECLGSGRLRVILGDDSEVSIPCVCCERGYEDSPGRIQSYQFLDRTLEVTITGVEVRKTDSGTTVRYSVDGWSMPETDLFLTRSGAQLRATELVREHDAEEKKRLGYKEKQHKTWSWNVSYWRGVIRRAKEEIARAEARLAVAPHSRKESAERDAQEPTI